MAVLYQKDILEIMKMKRKSFTREKRLVTSESLLHWCRDTISDIIAKGYKIQVMKYGEMLSNPSYYQIQISYNGNIFQRIWRKLTQW